MSPQARAELGLSPVDNTVDLHVFWVCMVALAVIVATLWGEQRARGERQVCAQQLDDGRRLLSYHLGIKGHERCTYTPPAPPLKRKGP